MSGADLIGAIEPWPSSHASLPDGWSWGVNPQIAQVQAHKSRLILQADALANLLAPDTDDRTLMHALYHGAAEWELWLLERDIHATVRVKQQCAHSALSLAELSGDLVLAEKVLARWRAVGPTHARFYRDGQRRLGAQRPAFNRQISALRATVNALVDQRDPRAAERLLGATESFARDGGLGEMAALRALAMEVLGLPGQEVVRGRFNMCVAFPTDPHAISAYMLALSRLTPVDAPPHVIAEGLRWFRSDLRVQAIGLSLRDTHDDDALFGEPIVDQAARVAHLAMESDDACDVDYAIFFCVKYLLRHGARSKEAIALMDAALRRHSGAPTVRVFRALTAHEIGHADAFDDLSVMLREPQASHVPPWLWQIAGEVFLRGQRWAEAILAFRRGGVDAPTFDDIQWLNQYAVSLARSGASDAARSVLERAVLLGPHEAIPRHNLEVLRGGLDEALTPHQIDPFAAVRIERELDRREYASAA